MAFYNKKLPDPSETIPYKGSSFAFNVLSETEYNTHINGKAEYGRININLIIIRSNNYHHHSHGQLIIH